MSNHAWSVVVLVVAAGCGKSAAPIDAASDANDRPIDAAADAPPQALDAAAGQVWIRGNGITGASNQIVLAFVTRLEGGPLGNICQPVTSDPFSFVAAVQTQGADPCTLTGVATIPDGTYTVTAGIYTPGQQTPTRCATTTVTVLGSGDVTLPAFGACP